MSEIKLVGYSSDDLGIGQITLRKNEYGYCCYCEKKLNKYSYTREHIIPKSRGGKDTLPCCKRCNSMRGSLTLQQFLHKVIYSDLGVSKKLLIIENINKLFAIYGNT